MFGNFSSNVEKKHHHPHPPTLSQEFIKEHPYYCELPDGHPVYFSQAQLNFFEIFFSSKKYPQYKAVLDDFCEDKTFEDLQTEVAKIINQVDIDIRREVMSSIIGKFGLTFSFWGKLVFDKLS